MEPSGLEHRPGEVSRKKDQMGMDAEEKECADQDNRQ